MLSAALAYVIWGLFPLFFHQLNGVAPLEVLCSRILWSGLFSLVLVTLIGKLPDLMRAVTTPKTLFGLLASGCCVTINWGSYIWAVAHDQALDASLAYYALPLVTLALGMVLLHERLTRRQSAALAIVVLAVLLLTLDRGRLPWILLALPISFGLYGYLRKLIVVDALVGVTVEGLLLAPFAALFLASQPGGGALVTAPLSIKLLLLLCGPITTIPLVLFTFGARRLTLTSLGLLQYLNPTLQMLTAVLLLDEPLGRVQMLCFLLIWLGLALYSLPVGRQAG